MTEKKRAYHKVAAKETNKKEPVADIQEPQLEEAVADIQEPQLEEAVAEERPDIHKQQVEAMAFEFIAGKLGSTSDQAAKAISAAGLDPDEVIGVGLRILKGEYFGKEN